MNPLKRSETLPSFLAGIAESYGSRTAMTGGDEDLTYGQLFEHSTSVAGELLLHGVGKGTRVGLLYGNDPRWAVYWAALMRIGAICVPLSTLSTPVELHRLVRHGDLQGLIVQETYRGRHFPSIVAESMGLGETGSATTSLELDTLPFLRWIHIDAETTPAWARPRAWVTPDGVDRSKLVATASAMVHCDDEAMCIYTSGQSAQPKGVCHTHGSIATKIFYLRDMLGMTTDSQISATLPFFWVGGLMMALFTGLSAGATVRCGERDPMYDGMQIGTTAVVENPFAILRSFPAVGMTETFAMYSTGRVWRAVGYPLAVPIDDVQPGFEIRIVDVEGDDVVDGIEGEILLRGPSVAARIYKVEKSSTFDANGFLRTGDLARREGSRIHFLGRRSDLIKVSGANVSPLEVEQELRALDSVAQAHVTGVENSVGVHVVAAAVVLAEGSNASAVEIRDQVAARLSTYKIPRLLVRVSTEEIPMTPSGKVRKPDLGALIAARSELPAHESR